MGAFLGAMLATGMEPAEIDAHCYEEWVRRNPTNDYWPSRTSLIRGHKAREMLDRIFGQAYVESLPREFYAASCDIRHHQLVIHRHGLLRHALTATGSLPVLAPPYLDGDRVLVDGTALNNLPVETMAARREGPVVAVDIKPASKRDLEVSVDSQPGQSRAARIPGLFETLVQVMLLASSNTTRAAREHADLVISPHDGGVGLLEFHQIDHAREAGRRAAREALAIAPPLLLPS
jgi:predicted acylesterase/phospholipase RssA